VNEYWISYERREKWAATMQSIKSKWLEARRNRRVFTFFMIPYPVLAALFYCSGSRWVCAWIPFDLCCFCFFLFQRLHWRRMERLWLDALNSCQRATVETTEMTAFHMGQLGVTLNWIGLCQDGFKWNGPNGIKFQVRFWYWRCAWKTAKGYRLCLQWLGISD
jgi:hypothetical protein